MRSSVSDVARRLTGLLAGLLLVLTLGTACGLGGGGSTTGADGDPGTGTQGAVLHEGPPGPGDDFPLLPSKCQSPTEPMPFKPCHITSFGSHAPTMAVWGDSHAWMYLPALRKAAEKTKVNLVMILAGGCPPADPVAQVAGQPYTECEAHDAHALQYVRTVSARKPPFALILGAFWSGYRAGYHGGFLDGGGTDATGDPTGDPAGETGAPAADYVARLDALAHHRTAPLFDELGKLKVRVDVIGQAATVPSDVAPCAAGRDPYQCDVPRSQALQREAATKAWLHKLMRPLSGDPLYIDTTGAYCSNETCHGVVDGTSTWYDDIHLGKGLTEHMTKYFLPAFQQLV